MLWKFLCGGETEDGSLSYPVSFSQRAVFVLHRSVFLQFRQELSANISTTAVQEICPRGPIGFSLLLGSRNGCPTI